MAWTSRNYHIAFTTHQDVIASEKSAVRKAAELRSAWTGGYPVPTRTFPHEPSHANLPTLRQRLTTNYQRLATFPSVPSRPSSSQTPSLRHIPRPRAQS